MTSYKIVSRRCDDTSPYYSYDESPLFTDLELAKVFLIGAESYSPEGNEFKIVKDTMPANQAWMFDHVVDMIQIGVINMPKYESNNDEHGWDF